jgi:bifunctional DNA-binding transcriptional regulator/antitoxin component of YhaV-PrlF toxin-antitoxin module
MEATATVRSGGRLTLPNEVRDALGIEDDDAIVFRVDGDRAVLAKTPALLSLAGSISVPATRRNAAWEDVLATTRRIRSTERR